MIFRWDISLIDSLPGYIKKIFEFFVETSNEWTAEVEKIQGRDMAAYIRNAAYVYIFLPFLLVKIKIVNLFLANE